MEEQIKIVIKIGDTDEYTTKIPTHIDLEQLEGLIDKLRVLLKYKKESEPSIESYKQDSIETETDSKIKLSSKKPIQTTRSWNNEESRVYTKIVLDSDNAHEAVRRFWESFGKTRTESALLFRYYYIKRNSSRRQNE